MKIYVGNLPFSATEAQVRDLFAQHGAVESVALPADRETGRPRGFGFVEINEKMQTSVPNIYAIGDVTGKLMLAHVGSAMGIVAAENIAEAETITLDYEMMPRATYCQPQVASFGLTEAQAKERGYTVKIGRFPFQANGKALGLGDYAGWVKLVVDEKYGEILGAHMIGPEVTELLPELTEFMTAPYLGAAAATKRAGT